LFSWSSVPTVSNVKTTAAVADKDCDESVKIRPDPHENTVNIRKSELPASTLSHNLEKGKNKTARLKMQGNQERATEMSERC